MEMAVTNLNSSTSVFCINPASNHITSHFRFLVAALFNSLLLPKS